MKDDAIKQFLDDSILPVPSANFNHVVLNGIPAIPARKKRFVSFDEPLIMILVFGAIALLLFLLVAPPRMTGLSIVLPVALVVFMIPIMIVAFNALTAKMLNAAEKHS
ncbi:hypothetical protein [Chitinophaga sp. Cy-1792]|uniref:hypothetical protein n=1 Tax=Chitinophaga sp. Cy-1792 TaxID=2608339 RepID=UPI0014212C14|nr:hypothetical protein [Chitinophaga sp. Cy-1792]NIG53844.1 hypothetical protein [Chitinophaga sp. Cy-1792]